MSAVTPSSAMTITAPRKAISPIDTALMIRLPRYALGGLAILFGDTARLFEKGSADLFELVRVGAIGHFPREAEGAFRLPSPPVSVSVLRDLVASTVAIKVAYKARRDRASGLPAPASTASCRVPSNASDQDGPRSLRHGNRHRTLRHRQEALAVSASPAPRRTEAVITAGTAAVAITSTCARPSSSLALPTRKTPAQAPFKDSRGSWMRISSIRARNPELHLGFDRRLPMPSHRQLGSFPGGSNAMTHLHLVGNIKNLDLFGAGSSVDLI
jgi:hypothetical protein